MEQAALTLIEGGWNNVFILFAKEMTDQLLERHDLARVCRCDISLRFVSSGSAKA